MTAAAGADFLVLSGISKRYGGVRALGNVEFGCGRGQTRGPQRKRRQPSTLIKIIAGVVAPDFPANCGWGLA